MSPRPYRLGRRAEAGEEIRGRVLFAARKILMGPAGARAFSIDAVAHEAGVSRMTVYYRFESRRGLLEAVFDDLAAAGRIGDLRNAFGREDPLEALSEFVQVFVRFWTSGRVLLRRLQGMSAVDPELERAMRSRAERRRKGLTILVHRIGEEKGLPPEAAPEDVVDVLFAITSFETFDALARGKRRPEDVARLIQGLALAVVERPPDSGN
jgi:AcrR family transcriptional regulator